MTRRTSSLLLVAGFLTGLFVRFSLASDMGVFDMEEYYKWGQRALEIGLPWSYHGIYFPLQYQLFEVCATVVSRSGLKFFTVFKLANLAFDIGCFSLLLALLKRQQASPLYALLYWLHPWFLTVFSLGYVDVQFAFCVLLAIWLLHRDTIRDYLLAGLPLGCAFMMKPQAQILVLAAFVYACFRWLRRKDARPFAMLAGPVLFFLAYEWFFIHTLRRPRFVHAAILPASYLNVTNLMPALTAQMTNIWSFVAYLLKNPGQHLIAVSDRIHLLPWIPAKYLAAGVVLGLIGLHVHRVERRPALSPSDRLMLIFAFASLAVPFLMTSAHENHLFLGTIFLVLIAASEASIPVKAAVQVLLIVQLLNLFSLYGTHPQSAAAFLRRTLSDELVLFYSFVCLVCFALIAKWLWNGGQRSDDGGQREEAGNITL
jgi:Dolichyl-phosphate-mannose-protein mannosyltransferase